MSKATFLEKKQGRLIAVLTAYDYPTAKAEAAAGIDVILVGDSVGTNVLGYTSEKEVTLADIAHHVRAVRRGAPETPILVDLPFGSYDSPAAAVTNAKRLVEAGADLVKFEGPRAEIAAALTAAGIACAGHLGLEPQHHPEMRLKGRSTEEAAQLLADAQALDRAGVSLLVLELIPEEVAARITKAIAAPTIGIGAGRMTDGQVLVVNDLLGITGGNFRHNRRYAELGAEIGTALANYVRDVHEKHFPAEENVFHLTPEEPSSIKGEKS